MLKGEILRANEALKDLTDDQVLAIETLSTNDENAVIAKKTGEIHGQYDIDIKEVLGLEKPAGVKTYSFLKETVFPKVKLSARLQKKLDDSGAKIEDLERVIADGAGDANIAQQLKDEKNKVKDLEEAHKVELENAQGEATKSKDELSKFKIDREFSIADGITFKDEKIISKEMRSMAIQSGKTAILNQYTPDWIDNGEGGKQMVFRDKDGAIANNKENGLKPFTAQELLMSQGIVKGVIQPSKQAKGAGTDDGKGGSGAGTIVDISSATTQVDADKIISKQLMDEGLARGTQAFTDKFEEVRKENNVSELPVRE